MRYKMIISYDGTRYKGFQAQINELTIEDELNKAISRLFKESIRVIGSGRTDAGVHAIGQCVHFDTNNYINPTSLKNGLNSILPEDIVVKEIENVDESFHARFSATSKEYRYYISKKNNPITRNYTNYIYNLDIDKMKEAIKLFEGTHDFKGFSFFVPHKPTERTIFEATINDLGDYIEIIFKGNGFLKYMVRIMVGTLIEIGLNKRNINSINDVFEKKDRGLAGKTALPKGLFLFKVNY